MDDRRERNTGRSGRESGSKRKIFRRTVFLMLVCGVGLFIPLIGQLWNIAIVHHEEYQAEAVEQQTRDVEVAAFRGSIYDSSGDVLAMSATVYNLILSPRDLEASVDESKYKDEEGNADLTAYQAALQAKKDLVLDGVLAVLDLDREALADRLERTYSQYEVLKTNIEKEQAEQLRAFITENKLSHFLYLTPTTKRYCPYGDLAAHVLGFCNSEGGAYGVEAIYNDVLEGTVGRVGTTRTGTGVEMYDSYSEYVDAEDGCDLTLTIDTTIQSYAERILEEGIKAYDVQRGGWCVVLDPQTGAVLAMASSPDYDPNQYGTIRDESLRAQVEADVQAELEKRQGEKAEGKTDEEIYQEAVNAATGTAQNKQWRSQAVNDTYEPGSTFKLMTVSTAYDLGATHAEDTYYCGGSPQGENWGIKCANTSGHGMQTLTEALMNSCNVAMMQIAQSIGMDRFYNFYKAFGLTEPTGIDLPGEGKGQFHKLDVASDWNEVALATASFGQRFTVTPIQMLNMVCAIVDDGKLKKPYVVKEVLGGDGSVKSTNETEVVRQVISEDTSAYMREAMEQVVANGTGKNAYVPGYRVGGKTATSEIQPEYDSDGKVLDTEDRYTASFIGVAPMDDPQIAVLVAINDLPESATHTGGTIAAPVVGRIMEDVLPYIGITPVYDDSESDRRELTVPSVSGKTRDDAISTLSDAGFDCIIKGDGDTVTDQVPNAGMRIAASGKVIVYMGEEKPTEAVEVPDLSGMSPDECRDTLEEYGLYLKQKGVSSAQITGDTTATKQSPEAGTKVSLGAVVTVEFSDTTTVNDR